ncbi:MAG: NAD(P)-binding protein [Candidatus Sericytochromatia bacterium]|nr:NAD(P)-binding protein [Candidatus Sericytochromatia bacterium]
MILIIGCGRLGANFAQRRAAKGDKVTILDFDAQNFQAVRDVPVRTMAGMEIDTEVLERAGMGRADCVIVVSRDENTNIMIADIARRHFKLQKVIVRIDNPELRQIYLDDGFEVISPILEATESLERTLETIKGAKDADPDRRGG